MRKFPKRHFIIMGAVRRPSIPIVAEVFSIAWAPSSPAPRRLWLDSMAQRPWHRLHAWLRDAFAACLPALRHEPLRLNQLLIPFTMLVPGHLAEVHHHGEVGAMVGHHQPLAGEAGSFADCLGRLRQRGAESLRGLQRVGAPGSAWLRAAQDDQHSGAEPLVCRSDRGP